MIDAPAPSPSPRYRVHLLACQLEYHGIETVATDPAVPIKTAKGQSFVVALRVPSAGAEWAIKTDERPLVDGEYGFGGTTVRGAFELQKILTIRDADLENVQRKADVPAATGGEATQFFLFSVLGDRFQSVPDGASTTLDFTRQAPDGQTKSTESFTVDIEPNFGRC